MDWFFHLEVEEQEFIKRFLLSSGSLKQLAKDYDVSYPTVRLRLNRLIDKIKIIEDNNDSFEIEIMQMVINEQLSLETAKTIIKKHKESLNE